MKSLLISLLLLLVAINSIASSEKVNYNGFKVFRITPKTDVAVEAVLAFEQDSDGFDFWKGPGPVGTAVDIMVPPSLRYKFNNFIQSLTSEDADVETYIEDVQKIIDEEQVNVRADVKFGWADYYTLDEIYDWLRSLAENDPEHVTLISAGLTYEQREILGVKVSFNPGNENRSVFLEGNIHAREWISSAVATFVLNEILTNTDPGIRQIVESRDWYVFPVTNPDGFVYTHTTSRLWRKTRVPYSTCYGADPNRNWDFHFNGGGSSNSPCSDTYHGPEAFSEPCTKALSDYISTIGKNLQAYIAFHSYSQIMLIPYGHTNQHLDNYDDLMSVGKKAVASLAQRYGTNFDVGNIVDVLYVASGGSMDWVKGTFGTPITYTFELRDTGRYGFVLPPAQILPSSLEIFDALITTFVEFDKILS